MKELILYRANRSFALEDIPVIKDTLIWISAPYHSPILGLRRSVFDLKGDRLTTIRAVDFVEQWVTEVASRRVTVDRPTDRPPAKKPGWCPKPAKRRKRKSKRNR